MRSKGALLCMLILAFSFLCGTLLGRFAAIDMEKHTAEVEGEVAVSNPHIGVNAEEYPTPTASPVPTIKPSTYFLVLSDKEICIYQFPPEGDAVFLYSTPVEINQLRQEDYERLCRGIKVNSMEEASALAEDFGS